MTPKHSDLTAGKLKVKVEPKPIELTAVTPDGKIVPSYIVRLNAKISNRKVGQTFVISSGKSK